MAATTDEKRGGASLTYLGEKRREKLLYIHRPETLVKGGGKRPPTRRTIKKRKNWASNFRERKKGAVPACTLLRKGGSHTIVLKKRENSGKKTASFGLRSKGKTPQAKRESEHPSKKV